jgi:hypothetical protein
LAPHAQREGGSLESHQRVRSSHADRYPAAMLPVPPPLRCRIGAFELSNCGGGRVEGGKAKGASRRESMPSPLLGRVFGRPCKSSTSARCRRPRSCGSPAPLGRAALLRLSCPPRATGRQRNHPELWLVTVYRNNNYNSYLQQSTSCFGTSHWVVVLERCAS